MGNPGLQPDLRAVCLHQQKLVKTNLGTLCVFIPRKMEGERRSGKTPHPVRDV